MTSTLLNYEQGDKIELKINYQDETVKFVNGTINGKTQMYLKEFATTVLGIQPETKEIVAAFIGKEVSDSYMKRYKFYELRQIKSKKNCFLGTIQKR